MPVPLSVLIGGVSALTVLVVAAVTLTVTLTFSTDALRAVARAHTESLVSLASTRIEGYLLRPILATESIRKYYMTGTETAIGNDPTNVTLEAAMGLMYTVFLNTQGLSEFGVYYRDGSTVLGFPHETSGASVVANVQRGTYLQTVAKAYTDNGTRAGPEVAGAFSDPIDYAFYWDPGSWLNVTVDYLSGPNAWKALAEPPYLWVLDPQTPDEYEYWGIGITRAVRNENNAVVGVAYGGLEMSSLRTFLDASRATPNSNIFVTDYKGFLLVGTHEESVTNLTIVPDGTVPPDFSCYGTEGESQLVYGGPQYIGCRHHPRDYAWAPLRQYARRPGGIANTSRVELVTLDGEHYYVGVEWVRPPNTDHGDLGLILIMPESDINGEIMRGRNIAIGVACAVFVVAVVIAFLTVYLMLTPLRDVASRMRLAADLEKDEGARGLSGISEVRELQESYFALSDELERLSAFVPASVLAARRGSTDEDLEDSAAPMDDSKTTHTASSHRSHASSAGRGSKAASRRSSNKRASSRDLAAAGGAASASALNTAASLARRNVAVLMVNCHGFHKALRGATPADVQRRYGAFVEAVMEAVQAAHGVVDQWNGDRFMVSFNAARHVAQPSNKAAAAAIAIATEAAPASLGLPVAIGISAGRADVGNLGCASAMRFCVLGPVVATAAHLSAWASDYADDGVAEGGVIPAPSRVLMCNHARQELETHYALRALDYRRPKSLAKRMLVSELVAPRANQQNADEWLYVVGGADQRIENQIFTLMQGGKYDEARLAVATAQEFHQQHQHQQQKDVGGDQRISNLTVIARAAALLQLSEFRKESAEAPVAPQPATTSDSPMEVETSHPASVPVQSE